MPPRRRRPTVAGKNSRNRRTVRYENTEGISVNTNGIYRKDWGPHERWFWRQYPVHDIAYYQSVRDYRHMQDLFHRGFIAYNLPRSQVDRNRDKYWDEAGYVRGPNGQVRAFMWGPFREYMRRIGSP